MLCIVYLNVFKFTALLPAINTMSAAQTVVLVYRVILLCKPHLSTKKGTIKLEYVISCPFQGPISQK